MWIACPGSMAFPENHEDGGSSTFADNGTASHEWSAHCLKTGIDTGNQLGRTLKINDVLYTMDEERAQFCQVYIDDVRRRAMGGMLFVEHKVDLSDFLGEGQGGTADALIYLPATKTLICEDLKYGTGEKVYAKYGDEINPQLGLYLLGCVQDVQMMGHEVETVTGVICQPRLHHIDEHTISVGELELFGLKASGAVMHAKHAMKNPAEVELFVTPGEKQCRWCRHKPNCAKLAKVVSEEMMADFNNIAEQPPAVAVSDTTRLARMFTTLPLVEQWCKAVKAETYRLVAAGTAVIGPDNQPLKFVAGKEGHRAWSDPKAAEAALLGQLGPKAYEEPSLITAPAAAKLLDKKATKNLWAEIFVPLIKKPPGRPMLALGSDPRPPVSGAAEAGDFDEIGAIE